jgi:hypothetical protein
MQTYLLAAGVITVLVGVIHSVFGEVLIFSRMRQKTLIPTHGAPLLRERHVRILWASWHLGSVFGWAFAAILLRLAFPTNPAAFQAFVETALIAAMLCGSLLVLVATKAKHPGWCGLLAVALLTWVA